MSTIRGEVKVSHLPAGINCPMRLDTYTSLTLMTYSPPLLWTKKIFFFAFFPVGKGVLTDLSIVVSKCDRFEIFNSQIVLMYIFVWVHTPNKYWKLPGTYFLNSVLSMVVVLDGLIHPAGRNANGVCEIKTWGCLAESAWNNSNRRLIALFLWRF